MSRGPEAGRLEGSACPSLHPGGLALTVHALESCALPPAALVLDVGCGAGATVRYLRSLGLRAMGLDASALLGAAARAGAAAPLLRADGAHLPFAAAALDAVLLECSLSLLPDLELALAECARVLAPGGWLVVSDLYARDTHAAEMPGLEPGCVGRFATRERLISAVTRSSFALTLWEDHSPALAAYVVRRLLAPVPPNGEPDIPGLVDAIARGRRVRAGYFLLVANRVTSKEGQDHA